MTVARATFVASPASPARDASRGAPTKRQTTTPGLTVWRDHYGKYEVRHTESRLPAATHVRLLREAIFIGDQLGIYDVYYTQPGNTIGDQWDHAVVGGRRAIAQWCTSYKHLGASPADPIAPPEAMPLRLIAVRCHFCDGDGRGSGGHGPYGDQCKRCWDAYPVLKQRGWCMAPTTFIPLCPPEDRRELTDRERRAWDRWTSSDAYRNA